MPDHHIDKTNLRITGRHKAVDSPNVAIENDVKIVVTQAYCAHGCNLVGVSDVTFDGYPAVTLLIEADGKQGEVHLSPIHGDSRKEGLTDIAPGTVCQLSCPTCKKSLDAVEDVDDHEEAKYHAIYLTKKLTEGSAVMISDVWGHYHSRIIDDLELISFWSAGDDDDDE